MNLNKELPENIVAAMNKMQEGAADLGKALNVPRGTDEVKKLKDTIYGLVIALVVATMCFVGSMAAHGVRSITYQNDITENIERMQKSNVKANRDRMMDSYNAQMVPMLEREVKDLKEEVSFQKLMTRSNRTLFESCRLQVDLLK